MSDKKVFILTEGGNDIGFGHITRCVSLYQAFVARNVPAALVVNGDSVVEAALEGVSHETFDWISDREGLLNMLKGAEITIIDSYIAGPDLYKEISDTVRLAAYIDDNKRLDYPRGVIINAGVYGKDLDYGDREGLPSLLGPRYTLLRREFINIGERPIKEEIMDILVTFGGDDSKGMTAVMMEFLNREYPHVNKNIIVGGSFSGSDIEKIETAADGNTLLMRNPGAKDMKDAMMGSDIAISACGQTLHELARTGTPTIGVCVADNQVMNMAGWKRAGFLQDCGRYNDKKLTENITKAISSLESAVKRKTISETGRRKIDGRGGARIVKALLACVGRKEEPMKVCLMGGNQAGVVGALTLLSEGYDIAACVSYTKELTEILGMLGIRVYTSIKDEGFTKALGGVDLLISCHGREVVKPDQLALPKLGCINVHPYLYKYKGADPVARALEDGDFRASVGVHRMRKEVDEGEVLVEEFVDVSGAKTTEEVYNRLYPYYSLALLKTLEMIGR